MNIPENFFQILVLALPAGLHMLLAFGGLGVYAYSAGNGLFSGLGRQAFLNKLSVQSSHMGSWLMLYIVLALAGSYVSMLMWFRWLTVVLLADPRMYWIMVSAPLAAVLLCVIYSGLARYRNKLKAAHTALGVLAAVSTWCLLLLAVSAKILALKLRDLDYAAPPPGLLLKAAGEPETLLHFAHWLLASIWAGAALTLLYMLLRRNRDDYGRDYYVYSSRITARWTWIFGMAQLIPWGVLAYRIIPALDSEVRRGSLVPAAAFVLFSLIACVLWIGVSRSETPMRKKPSMIAGAVLLWLALSAHAAYLVMAYELFPLIVRAVQA